jgi:hypothetical protein
LARCPKAGDAWRRIIVVAIYPGKRAPGCHPTARRRPDRGIGVHFGVFIAK